MSEAIKTNTEVHEALESAEQSRYRERENERANILSRIEEEARKRNQEVPQVSPEALPPVVPVVSLEIIQADFIDYLKHLEKLKNEGSTYGWDILESLMQWYESCEIPEQKQDALLSLMSALDDARTAYHARHHKYVTGKDYTCQKGFEERLLDQHSYLRPVEVQAPTTPVEQTLHALTEPFLSHAAALEGCRATFSAELYRMYCEVAGYQIVKPKPIEIYALIEDIQKNDTELEEQYLSSLETSSPLSERMKDYHRNQFRSLLGSMRQKSVLASAKTTPALKFLQDQSLVRITSYQPEETLQQVGPEKTEAEIFNEMLERYPCFLGAAHLKLILTLHNLYGVFDGDFETYATFATLKKVAESGIITHSTEDIAGHPIEDAYSQHLLSQEVPFYDFYPSLPGQYHQLLQTLTHPLHQMPCSEDVLVEFLNSQSFFITTDIKHQLAVLAAKTGYSNALKVLLNPPYSVSPNYQCPQERETLLMLAALKGHTEIVKALIHAGADVNHANQIGSTALMIAARNGHTEIVEALIDAGADVNFIQFGMTALMIAALTWNTEIVKALIHAGADVNHANSYGQTALMFATSHGHTEIVKALIAADADVVNHATHNGETALTIAAMMAAMNGHIELLKALIDEGFDVNHANQDGDTALIWAASNGHTDVVKALIAAGAHVNHATHNGKTALLSATSRGNTDLVKALIDAGADVDHANSYGQTALMFAALTWNTEIVKALIHAGAHVNHANQDGETVLMRAARNGHTEIVNALINAGADVNHIDGQGKTALQYAEEIHNSDMINMLKNARRLQILKNLMSSFSSIFTALHSHANNNIPLNPRSQLKNAILEDDHQGVLQLLQKNPEIGNTYCPEVQSSALMYALQQGRMVIVEDLMQGEITPYYVKEALIYAIQHPTLHNAIPTLAPKHTLNILIREKFPMMAFAAKFRSLGAIRIFMEAGADLNQPDTKGYTALMYAAEKQDRELFECLKVAGARIDVILPDGRNPVQQYFQKFPDSESVNQLQHTQSLLLNSRETNANSARKKPRVL